MHTVLSFIPLAVFLAISAADSWWRRRPAVKARWAALSLRGKITRQVRGYRLGAGIQAGLLALNTSLYLSGFMSLASWLCLVIFNIFYLGVFGYLLHAALGARKAYDELGPLAYLAEVRNAFGVTSR